MKETKLFKLVTGTEMKPWLSRNMLPNINTCENGWSNFSANLRVVLLKLLELTQFAWPNLSIYFNFLCAMPRDDVIERTRFLMRPPVSTPQCTKVCVPHAVYGSWWKIVPAWNYPLIFSTQTLKERRRKFLGFHWIALFISRNKHNQSDWVSMPRPTHHCWPESSE